MAWYDFLKTAGNNIQDGASSLFNKIKYVNEPTLPVLQMADNGEVDLQKSFELSMAQPKTPKENLLGRTFTINSEAQNPETGELEVSKVSKFQPGLLNDIRSGAKENFATGFAAPNWEQNKTPDGRKKGLGYRLGEGLGSMARFAESPLGRSLLMAGIVGVTGGGALPALTYGATTGMINQQARMKDKIYRNSLIEQGQNSLRNTPGFANLDPTEQQAQLDRIANQVNSYRGYLGDDTYKQVLAGMQLRDNAEYRNALLKGQRLEQDALIAQKQAELKQKALSDAADRELKNRELNIKEMQVLNEGKKQKGEYENPKIILNNVERLWAKTPQGRAIKGTSKGKAYQTGIANALGMNNNDVSAYMAIAESMVTPLARQIAQEKGNVSDRDIARARAMLPQVTDSYEQGMAKINAVRKLLNDLEQGDTSNAIQTQTTTNEGWAF